MSRCVLCFSFTGDMTDFTVTFDWDDKERRVCSFCLKNLALLGFNAHQTICLKVFPNHKFYNRRFGYRES